MTKDVSELIGVYDADSTLVGEISYWIGARLGRTHCSLCELTHGLFTVKKEWTECSRSLAVPICTFHRNDAPADVLTACNGRFPILLARRDSVLQTVLDRHGLESFGGDTPSFVSWLEYWLSQSRP